MGVLLCDSDEQPPRPNGDPDTADLNTTLLQRIYDNATAIIDSENMVIGWRIDTVDYREIEKVIEPKAGEK